jgi:competence ComEA-like helix-hairpin-helix protein
MGLSRSERVVLCLLSAAILVGRIARDRMDRSGELLLSAGGTADSAAAGDSTREEASGAPPPWERATTDSAAAEESIGWPLDLNAATEEELVLLPGIGPAKARAILERRARKGPYSRVEDLLDVPGIGPKTLARFREMVVVATPGKRIGGSP